MIRSLSSRKHGWRAFTIQVALLCLLSLHSLGLLHKHTAAVDQDACVACQLINQQAALNLPDAGSGLLLPALVLLFIVVPWHRGVVAGDRLFTRPRSRAPPSFFRFS